MHGPLFLPIHLYLPWEEVETIRIYRRGENIGMSILKQIKSILNKNEAPPADSDTARPIPADRRRSRRLNHKGRRVLIVDDSATIVASLGAILRSAGCRISEAPDAETGIEAVRRENPDLVFLDIVLPGMNGFAALRQIRRDPLARHTPIIMISGNEQATEQFYAKRIGADDFMKKPFSRHEVFARMESLVNAGKLPRLDLATSATRERAAQASYGTIQRNTNLSNEMIARMTPLEARSQLTLMGLQYFSQDQFSAAIERGDSLAVDLFIIGGGVEITA